MRTEPPRHRLLASGAENAAQGPLVYRHHALTRVTHWTWATYLFFLRLSGLQILNPPTLYIGQQSGFDYDNAVLSIGTVDTPHGQQGRTTIIRPPAQYDRFSRAQRASPAARASGVPCGADHSVLSGLGNGASCAFLLCLGSRGDPLRLACVQRRQ